MSDWRAVAGAVREMPGVEAAAPFILTKVALLRTEEYARRRTSTGSPWRGLPRRR
jgi:hypothetical protein